MIEKIRLGGEWNTKKIVAAVLFGAIIVTFVVVGPRTANLGEETGSGVAALVNDVVISAAEFRQRTEQMEQNSRQRFEGLPEAQRRMISKQLRTNELERLIAAEAVYQAANKRGILAADGEIKAQLLQIPVLVENGRFMGDRYRMFLEQQNTSAEDFERRIRKEVVLQKVFELFNGAATPSSAEAEHTRQLSEQKISLRFASVTRDDLRKLGLISDADVARYLKDHAKEVEAYYKDNLIEFTKAELYHAHDIVIRIDEKRPDTEALKKAAEVRKQLSAANFAKLAAQYSEDPGSKTKGGDLGEKEKGSLNPEFEAAVAQLKPGQISEPLKIAGAYHVVWLEGKKAGGTTSFADAQNDAARRQLARTKESEVRDRLNATVEKGDKKEVDALLARAGVKWQDSGDFDLAATTIPKLGDAKDILPAVLAQGRKGGMIKKLIASQGNFIVADVTGWKSVPSTAAEPEGSRQMIAYRRSEPIIEAWAKDVEAKASVQRNTQMLR